MSQTIFLSLKLVITGYIISFLIILLNFAVSGRLKRNRPLTAHYMLALSKSIGYYSSVFSNAEKKVRIYLKSKTE